MYTLTLLNDWQIKLEEKIKNEHRKDNYRSIDSKILRKKIKAKKNIKGILKLIAQSEVIESNDNYTVYRLRGK